jgi:hypothetical protein
MVRSKIMGSEAPGPSFSLPVQGEGADIVKEFSPSCKGGVRRTRLEPSAFAGPNLLVFQSDGNQSTSAT